jgi:hypothetical protein
MTLENGIGYEFRTRVGSPSSLRPPWLANNVSKLVPFAFLLLNNSSQVGTTSDVFLPLRKGACGSVSPAASSKQPAGP